MVTVAVCGGDRVDHPTTSGDLLGCHVSLLVKLVARWELTSAQ